MTRLLRLCVACSAIAASAVAPARAQISFTTAVGLALKSNPKILAAQADVDKTLAAVQQLRDAYIPNVVGGSGLGPPSYGFPLGQPSIFNITSQSLVFSYSQRDYLRAAHASLDAATLNLKDIRESVAEDTIVTYLALDRDINVRPRSSSNRASPTTSSASFSNVSTPARTPKSISPPPVSPPLRSASPASAPKTRPKPTAPTSPASSVFPSRASAPPATAFPPFPPPRPISPAPTPPHQPGSPIRLRRRALQARNCLRRSSLPLAATDRLRRPVQPLRQSSIIFRTTTFASSRTTPPSASRSPFLSTTKLIRPGPANPQPTPRTPSTKPTQSATSSSTAVSAPVTPQPSSPHAPRSQTSTSNWPSNNSTSCSSR